MQNKPIRIVFSLMALFCNQAMSGPPTELTGGRGTPDHTTAIWSWTDAQGNVSFSDVPPKKNQGNVVVKKVAQPSVVEPYAPTAKNEWAKTTPVSGTSPVLPSSPTLPPLPPLTLPVKN